MQTVMHKECEYLVLKKGKYGTYIIAIHNTNLGPALGGTRMRLLSEEAAKIEVANLAEAMTYKAAIAGIPFGGGKGFIIGDPQKDKTPDMLKEYGEFVETFDGEFLTGEDSGLCPDDLQVMGETTSRVCIYQSSIATALGMYWGLEAIESQLDIATSATTIALQGLGNVGFRLMNFLAPFIERSYVTDVRPVDISGAQVLWENVEWVDQDKIYDVEADIFVPCAFGGVVNPDTIRRMKFKAIGGCANNQLSNISMSKELEDRGILYAPDYAINAGGLIGIANKIQGYTEDKTKTDVASIFETITDIFDQARLENRTTVDVANEIAKKRFS